MDIKQLFYERAELKMSDHKPVMSMFRIKVKVLVKEKQNEIYQSLVRQLDAWENEQMPKVMSFIICVCVYLEAISSSRMCVCVCACSCR